MLFLFFFQAHLRYKMLFSPPFFWFHSYICSGGIVLLISSSIIQSSQVHVQFLPITVGLLSKLYILFPSLSCFNRSVVFIIPLLTGVSSKCFRFAKFIFHAFHFQPECCRNWSLSSLVHHVSIGVLACTSCPLEPFFLCLSTYKVLVMFLVPLF